MQEGQEIEIKFAIPWENQFDDMLREVLAFIEEHGWVISKNKSNNLFFHYFDTTDHTFLKTGCTLRGVEGYGNTSREENIRYDMKCGDLDNRFEKSV